MSQSWSMGESQDTQELVELADLLGLRIDIEPEYDPNIPDSIIACYLHVRSVNDERHLVTYDTLNEVANWLAGYQAGLTS